MLDLDPPALLPTLIALENTGLKPRAREVDLFVVPPIEFGELWRESKLVELRSSRVRIASIPHLITMKRLANRPEDQVDIEALEAILAAKGSS